MARIFMQGPPQLTNQLCTNNNSTSTQTKRLQRVMQQIIQRLLRYEKVIIQIFYLSKQMIILLLGWLISKSLSNNTTNGYC